MHLIRQAVNINMLNANGSLKISFQFRIHFKHNQGLITSPISANVNFAPSLMDPSFQLWHNRVIRCVKDLLKDGHFIYFEKLKKDLNIPHSGFFTIYRYAVMSKNTFL